MDVDAEKLEQAVLALLHLNTFEHKLGKRAWKALPWSVMDQLHDKGYISDPATKASPCACQTRGLGSRKNCLRSFLPPSSRQRRGGQDICMTAYVFLNRKMAQYG